MQKDRNKICTETLPSFTSHEEEKSGLCGPLSPEELRIAPTGALFALSLGWKSRDAQALFA